MALYYPALTPTTALELLAHRIAWSSCVLASLVVALRRGPALRALVTQRRPRALLAGASLAIGANWGLYIWAVTHERVLETSLGYFINPLVTVLLGVVVLRERLSMAQRLALLVAAVAIATLTLRSTGFPWVALSLASTFGIYALLKKMAGQSAIESLAFETWLLAPPAIGFLALLTVHGSLSIPNGTHAALLASSGLVTSLPLLCFGAAATRLPMSTLGVMQYLAPTIQFFLGIWVFHEPMPVSRLIGFTIIWLAIAIFTAAALHGQRRPHATTSSAASPASPSRRILS